VKQLKRPLVTRAGADDTIEARNGLSVVIQDFRSRVDDGADGFAVALEVRDKDFNAAAGSPAADFVDDESEGAGAAEIVVVAIDARNHGVLKAEGGDGLRDAARLVEVNGIGAAFGHGAESTAARAEIAEHHECGGFVMPALADVGAVGAFADGVKGERAGETLEVVVVLAHGSAGLEPLGLGSGDAA